MVTFWLPFMCLIVLFFLCASLVLLALALLNKFAVSKKKIALNSATIREADLSTTSMVETQFSTTVSKSCIGVFNKVNSL